MKKIIEELNNLRNKAYDLVENDNLLFANIPKSLHTKKLVLFAVKKIPTAINYIDNAFKTNEVIIEAIKQNGSNISEIPRSTLDNNKPLLKS